MFNDLLKLLVFSISLLHNHITHLNVSSYSWITNIDTSNRNSIFSFCSQDCFCVELADESRHTLNIRDETGDICSTLNQSKLKSTDSLIHCAALISLNFL